MRKNFGKPTPKNSCKPKEDPKKKDVKTGTGKRKTS
jgi:hypothetical protein